MPVVGKRACTGQKYNLAGILKPTLVALKSHFDLLVQAMSADEAKERQHRLAKMRSLLLHHEAKSRRLKAIKSKSFHRQANRAAKRKVPRFLAFLDLLYLVESVSASSDFDSLEKGGCDLLAFISLICCGVAFHLCCIGVCHLRLHVCP